MSETRARLITILKDKSVRTGAFTLSSGKQTDFYVDARQTSLNADGAAAIAQLILDRLHPDIVAVGGETLGADPIACATAALSSVRGTPIHAFLIRKQPKGHGTGQLVEGMGNLAPGAKVCIVEDTSTTGASMLRAAARATEAGLQVAQCITVVDRQEGAADAVAQAGYHLEALTTRADLVRR